mgnify:CR=1 FL=1
MKHPVEKPAGKIKRGLYFRIGEWYLGLYGPVVQSQRCVTEEEPLHITENFLLPVWIGRAKVVNYESAYTYAFWDLFYKIKEKNTYPG